MRALGKGRRCALLSDTDESLKIDRFFRRANWHRNRDSEVVKLDK
ncbi:MAG: penicillin amidase, partial [Oleiphilaceae bacterium]